MALGEHSIDSQHYESTVRRIGGASIGTASTGTTRSTGTTCSMIDTKTLLERLVAVRRKSQLVRRSLSGLFLCTGVVLLAISIVCFFCFDPEDKDSTLAIVEASFGSFGEFSKNVRSLLSKLAKATSSGGSATFAEPSSSPAGAAQTGARLSVALRPAR